MVELELEWVVVLNQFEEKRIDLLSKNERIGFKLEFWHHLMYEYVKLIIKVIHINCLWNGIVSKSKT